MTTIKIKIVFIMLIMLVLPLVESSAQVISDKQTIDQTISAMTIELQHKILLTDDQANRLTDILKNYFSKVSNDPNQKAELKSKANVQINSILDKKQQAKFEILKNDWWKSN